VSCTHPTTEISGHVMLDSSCIYHQAFTIKASDTTLDCQGAQIVGTDQYLVTVAGTIENVTVTNCHLVGGNGAAVRPPKQKAGETDEALRQRSPSNVVFSNLHITQSTNVGMYIHHHVVGATIKDSVIVGNSSAGVYMSPYGRGSLVQNNLIQDNGHTKPDGIPRIGWYRREGVAIDGSSEHIIEGNHFDNNAFGGVLLYKNCWEHHSTDPDSTPRLEHAHSNVIRNNTFSRMPFGVWVAARQSRDLDEMDCGDPTPYSNPIVLLGFFHPSYGSYKSSYATTYLPWVSVWPDYAEKNVVEGNVFQEIELGGVRVEDDETRVTGNLFLGSFDYVFVGAPFRAKLDNHPALDTVITGNSFWSPTASQFGEHLALIPGEHEGTVLQDNFRACQSPWGRWMHHGSSVVAYEPDGTAPGGCAEQVRTCVDGTLDGSFVDEQCNPASPGDGGATDGGLVESGTDGGLIEAGADGGATQESGVDGDAGGSKLVDAAGTDALGPGGAPGASMPVSGSEAGCHVGPTLPRGRLPMLAGLLVFVGIAGGRRARWGAQCTRGRARA
jgi:hypothetical protein